MSEPQSSGVEATAASQPSGPHTPVSNVAETAIEEVEASLSQPPSQGSAPGTSSPRSDGTENVPAHQLRTINLGATAETAALFVAPTGGPTPPDIGQASYGPPLPQPEIVHGPDDRVQINNLTDYPWRVHASLLITANDNSVWQGTAWFIGPRTLITAGHCVCIKNSGAPGRDGWVRSIQVMPGRNGNTLPFGTITSNSFRSVTGWVNDGDQNYDYGAIIIPTNLGNTVGWFGFGVYPEQELLNIVGNISGYPGDKLLGTQWYDAQVIGIVDAGKINYTIDTVGGQSGSAVYRIINGVRYAIAIHNYGGNVSNSGTRIIVPVYTNMVNWRG